MSDAEHPGRRAGSRGYFVAACLAWVVAILALVVVAGLALWKVFDGYGTPVTVTVDGYTEQVRTTRGDVAALLGDLGLKLRPEDALSPLPEAALEPGLDVRVRRARLGQVMADGMQREVYSRADTVGALLADAGFQVGPEDEIWLEGRQRVTPETALPGRQETQAPLRFARARAWSGHDPAPVQLSLRRAVPITVDDGSVPFTIYTTAPTVGEALLGEQLTLYLGDRVQPSLGSRVRAGMRVVIQRSQAVLITVDGRTVRTRTRGQTVGDALTELGIVVAGNDRVEPAMNQPVVDNLGVRIVRVLETVEVERRSIPFESVLLPDPELEIDNQRLSQQGQAGEFRKRWRLVYEDGQEKSRTLVDAWTASDPVTQVTNYGQKIVLRTVDTPDGPLQYWRKMRAYATAYSKSTAGVSQQVSWYGVTRSGLPMGKGMVAVDPTVVPWRSRLYVPGYGIGFAGDTGGGVRGRFVDLGYDDDNLQPWSRWVDVYLLAPVPPAYQIRWVLPNWPQY